jgi:alkylated DNA repair dioxygenase AlkB
MFPVPDVILVPAFVAEPARLFDQLLRSVVWDQRLRARKTASFGVPYDYSGMVYPQVEMPGELVAVGDKIHAELGFEPNNCLLNYYADGESSMGFHSDSTDELAAGTGVAIVSLGSEREMVFRYKPDRSHDVARVLSEGSLLYMSHEFQSAWLHAIPKSRAAGPRMSLSFRRIVKHASA